MLEVETAVAAGGWDAATDWSALAAEACVAALAATPHAGIASAPVACEVAVRFAGDAEVRGLNARYRGKDAATNVLSFPMLPPAAIGALSEADGEVLLGDIVLAENVVAGEAAEKGIAVAAHASHLVVHGLLHLLGYTHASDTEADAMEEIERAALARIGIADPYAACGAGQRGR